jgi:hypothetical protein
MKKSLFQLLFAFLFLPRRTNAQGGNGIRDENAEISVSDCCYGQVFMLAPKGNNRVLIDCCPLYFNPCMLMTNPAFRDARV